MKAERARLARLRRLERIRAIVRQTALIEAGRAEARLAQLETLGQRTAGLIAGYASRTDAQCGEDLVRQGAFVAGLARMAQTTRADIARARDNADLRAAEAAAAERSRAAAQDRADATARDIARRQAAQSQPLGARGGPRKP